MVEKNQPIIKTIKIDNSLKVTPEVVKIGTDGGEVRIIIDPGIKVDLTIKAFGIGGGGGGGTVIINS
jgi:hypothetical protein